LIHTLFVTKKLSWARGNIQIQSESSEIGTILKDELERDQKFLSRKTFCFQFELSILQGRIQAGGHGRLDSLPSHRYRVTNKLSLERMLHINHPNIWLMMMIIIKMKRVFLRQDPIIRFILYNLHKLMRNFPVCY
jgi:hypothetical protein